MREYLDHHFPTILHNAVPTRLTGELREKLNSFFPLYRKHLENAVQAKGRLKSKYKFLRPHHMAVILMPSSFVIALDTTNATIFMTGFFCFELDRDYDNSVLATIMSNQFFLNSCYFYKFNYELLDENHPEREKFIAQKAIEYEELEYKLILKGEKMLRISPKIFKTTDIQIKENYCFVLMPFRQELKEIYEDCIKVAVEACNMMCQRADDIFHNKSIMEVIWNQICCAELIIADLTGRNPNVFYEVGIAHTLGKEVIMITQNEEDVPFDLRHLKYILYGFSKRGQEKLIDDIKMTIKSIKGIVENINDHKG